MVVAGKEWRSFVGNDLSMHMVYVVLVLLWSALLAGSGAGGVPESVVLWLLPFSVIVVSNAGQGVFVSERVSGAVEILLTSGLGRFEIVSGKMLFVGVLGTLTGYACMLLGMLWLWLLERWGVGPGSYPVGADFVVFACAVAVNTAMLAVLSVLLPNPRLSHFVSFLFMVLLLAAYYPAAATGRVSPWALAAALAVCAVALSAVALAVSRGERIARPVTL